MIVLPNGIDVESALMRHSRRHLRRRERLDEHADGNQPVRKHQMRDRIAPAAKLAESFHDFHESGRNPRHRPAGLVRCDVTRRCLLDRPVGWNGGKRGLDHRGLDLGVDRQIGERELLDDFAALVQHARLEKKAGGRVGPEAMPVTEAILRLEDGDVGGVAADAFTRDKSEIVELRQ